MDQREISETAYRLLLSLQHRGVDEVFVTYLNGWFRAKHPGQSKIIRVCWLATPVS